MVISSGGQFDIIFLNMNIFYNIINRDILNNFHEQFNTKLINKVSKIPLSNKQIDKPKTKSQSKEKGNWPLGCH